jgi:hypothetical protein
VVDASATGNFLPEIGASCHSLKIFPLLHATIPADLDSKKHLLILSSPEPFTGSGSTC